MRDLRGMTALVTGASSGIGTAFAEQLAASGTGLVLVARRGEELRRLAERLRAGCGIPVEVMPQDLAAAGATRALVERVDAAGLTVDLLVNNAGFGVHADLVTAEPARMADMIQVNCAAVVDLTARLLPGMVARGRGGVLNVASTGAFQPVPHMAVYGATKAFVLSFSEALWAEVRGSGVCVTAVCPGATDTGFFAVAGENFGDRLGARMSPDRVAAIGLAALRRGRPCVVSGWRNAALAAGSRLAPRRLSTLVTGRLMAPP
jgi:short-subunit dehydrogenase